MEERAKTVEKRTNTMEDRRKLERFELQVPAHVVLESDGNQRRVFDLTTKDVSSDGAYLFTPQPFPEGAMVNVEFVISLDAIRKFVSDKGRARVRVRGRVIRVEQDGAAIRFESKYKITASGGSLYPEPSH